MYRPYPLKRNYKLDQETVDLVRHIFQARIDHSARPSAVIAYRTALDVFNYAIEGNEECLVQFDYLMTKEDANVRNDS